MGGYAGDFNERAQRRNAIGNSLMAELNIALLSDGRPGHYHLAEGGISSGNRTPLALAGSMGCLARNINTAL